MKMPILLVRILLLLVFSCGVASAEVKPFVNGSWQHLKQQPPQIISFWSVDCSSCYQELALWPKLLQQYPQLKLVLVSTDERDAQAEVQAVLHEKGLSKLNNWQFADRDHQKLRHQIDPNWYGELPRHYLFDRNGKQHAISGLLSPDHIKLLMR